MDDSNQVDQQGKREPINNLGETALVDFTHELPQQELQVSPKPIIVNSVKRVGLGKLTTDLKKYALTIDIPPFGKEDDIDWSTPPPGTFYFPSVTQTTQRLTYRERFSRPDILPPPTAPFERQLEACAHRWAPWAATIENPKRREEVIEWISKRMELVYHEFWIKSQDGSKIDHEAASAQDPVDTAQKSKRKRAVSPSRVVVVKSQAYKGSELYAVTIGELQEFGISVADLEERVSAQDFGQADNVMIHFLEQLGRNAILKSDWLRRLPKTKYNTWGRDLLVYCLFEVQESRKEIQKLEGLFVRFSHANQQRNTKNRIHEEQDRHDHFLALALELHGRLPLRDITPDLISLRTSSPTPINVQPSEVREPGELPNPQLLHLISDVVEEDALQGMMDVFKHSGFILDDFQIDNEQNEGKCNAITEGKGLLGDLLAALGSLWDLSGRAGNTDEPANEPDIFDESELLKDQIAICKGRLKELLPSLETEDLTTNPRTRFGDGLSKTSSQPLSDEVPCYGGPQDDPQGPEYYRQEHEIDALPATQKTDNGELRLNKKQEPPIQSSSKRELEMDGQDGSHQVGKKAKTENNPHQTRDVAQVQSAHIETELLPANFPSQQEVLKAIPVEGLTPSQLKNAFAGQMNPFSAAWMSLVRSTADYNKGCNRWFRKPGLFVSFNDTRTSQNLQSMYEENSRGKATGTPSHIIKLKIRPEFNPEDYSCRTVNYHKGFRFRYLSTSTLAQRIAMDDIVHTYTDSHVKKAKPGTGKAVRPYGSYQILTHPKDPMRRDLVHGFWDNHDRTTVMGADWFYRGLEKPDSPQEVAARQPRGKNASSSTNRSSDGSSLQRPTIRTTKSQSQPSTVSLYKTNSTSNNSSNSSHPRLKLHLRRPHANSSFRLDGKIDPKSQDFNPNPDRHPSQAEEIQPPRKRRGRPRKAGGGGMPSSSTTSQTSPADDDHDHDHDHERPRRAAAVNRKRFITEDLNHEDQRDGEWVPGE